MTELTAELLSAFDDSIDSFETAATLPAEIYTSEQFLEFEKRALFDHEWLCVGLASAIPGVGDWYSSHVNDEPLIIARGKDGEIRAFSAICQHRAMQVCEGSGNRTRRPR